MHGVGRRFLEHLQQRVGGRRRQAIGLADEEDLPAGLRRRAVGGLPDLRPDRVDVDVPALGLHQELVRVVVLGGEPAVAALAAPAEMTQEGRGERPGGERFPAALGTREHVRVMWPFGCPTEEGHRTRLAGHTIEDGDAHDRTVSPRSDDVSPGARPPADRSLPRRAAADGARASASAPSSRSPRAFSSASRTSSKTSSCCLVRLDHDDPLRVLLGDPEVRVRDLRVEVLPFHLHPIRRLRRSEESAFGFEVEQDHEVREQALRPPDVQRQDVLLAQTPPPPLVRERRIDVAVADHDLAVREGGPDHGVDGLRAGGGEQERFGARLELPGVRVQEQLPESLADLGPAGLPSDQDVVPLRAEMLLGEFGSGSPCRSPPRLRTR